MLRYKLYKLEWSHYILLLDNVSKKKIKLKTISCIIYIQGDYN